MILTRLLYCFPDTQHTIDRHINMDTDTADALHERLSVLEHRILPSYSKNGENDSIVVQIEDRLRRLQEFELEHGEVRQFLQLARALGLYRHIPVGATSSSKEDEDVKRQVVVAQLQSFQTLLAKFDEMRDLLPVLDRLNVAVGKSGLQSGVDELQRVVAKVSSVYHALSLQSIELAEHFAHCVQRDNENWAGIEMRLKRIEERLDPKPN